MLKVAEAPAPLLPTADKLKLVIWTNIPNHHQAPFFAALRAAGADLLVCYYESLDTHPQRLAMGWDRFEQLPEGERYVRKSLDVPGGIFDWRDRTHIVPGYRQPFLRRLVLTLSQAQVPWAHWSEPAHPGLRWWLSYPLKHWYARQVNRYALGAFGTGRAALADFCRWGIAPERVALLPYSTPPLRPCAPPDPACAVFGRGRPAFLFLGSLCHRKAIDVVLKAFALATRADTDWRLLLVGDDRSGGRYALRQARDLGLGGRVLFRGPVAQGEVAGVLASARVLLSPSRFDGWGMSIPEAASMGLALIGSERVSAAQHLIDRGENGFIAKAGNVASLARCLAAYVNQPDLARKHGEHSLRVAEDCSPQRNAERLLRALASWKSLASALPKDGTYVRNFDA